MPTEDRFKQAVTVTLAKRAANQCSNPDGGAITSGPTYNPGGSVNVGEAAHIYGANPGSARFDTAMASVDRSDISNAIWLCGNCHKLIDDDEVRYPAGLLFEWQRDHERRISEQVGKAGADARRRFEDRYLEEFGKISYLAQRLITEKGPYWEYRLTAEMLRFETEPVLRRWRALERGLYIKPNNRVGKTAFIPWMINRFQELKNILGAFNGICTEEFPRAWGEPGVAGSDIDIVIACRLFAEMCERALDWEENVRFTSAYDIFSDLKALFVGVAGVLLNEAARVPAFTASIFKEQDNPTGEFVLSLKLSLPEHWSELVEAEIEKASAALLTEINT
jgi:hypothetical protein